MELILHRRRSSEPNNKSITRNGSYAHICLLEEVETYWFCANVQLRTPLAVLEKHGTFHPGPPTQLPHYGAAKDGKWIPVYKSRLVDTRGVQDSRSHEPHPPTAKSNTDYGTRLPPFIDSDIGPIPSDGGEYIHFVESFRRIIEEDDLIDVTIAKLKALLQHSNAYQVFAKKHAPDLVTMWFLNTLLAIPGLDPHTAQRLFAAGYRTIDELRVANDLVLRERTHIDDVMLAKIRRSVGNPAPLQQKEAAA